MDWEASQTRRANCISSDEDINSLERVFEVQTKGWVSCLDESV